MPHDKRLIDTTRFCDQIIPYNFPPSCRLSTLFNIPSAPPTPADKHVTRWPPPHHYAHSELANQQSNLRNLTFFDFQNFCVVLCIVFVTFCVLFLCKCVLYYCHRVATQLQLTNISHHTHTLQDPPPQPIYTIVKKRLKKLK